MVAVRGAKRALRKAKKKKRKSKSTVSQSQNRKVPRKGSDGCVIAAESCGLLLGMKGAVWWLVLTTAGIVATQA